ncbi:unnamed protein product [Calypogeia fissa]
MQAYRFFEVHDCARLDSIAHPETNSRSVSFRFALVVAFDLESVCQLPHPQIFEQLDPLVLGRLASRIAVVLQGKDKPTSRF